MLAGGLRHRISIQEPVTTRAIGGAVSTSWQEKYSLRARVEPLDGREYHAARQAQTEVSTRFRVRYRSGITPQMRIVCDGEDYDIVSVVDRNLKHRELVIMAKKRSEGD